MPQPNSNNALRYAGLATQWMVMLALAVWGGIKLDTLTGLKFPLFLLLLPLVALIVSFWQLMNELNQKK